MNSVSKFSIPLLNATVKITFINLCFIKEESIFRVFSGLYDSYENTFDMSDLFIDNNLFRLLIHFLKMFMEPDFFPLKRLGISFTKA